MTENTKIEWAHHTFNPWIGCTEVSPACDHCYARELAKRYSMAEWGTGKPRQRTSAANWKLPLKWNRQAEKLGIRYRVFCASLADVFDNEVDPQWRADLFALIAITPNLDWLLLTKRIGNAAEMIAQARIYQGEDVFYHKPIKNIWIGATICNQKEADRDIPKLMKVPAAVRFLSMEPLLGDVDIRWALSRNKLEIAAGFLQRGMFSPGFETLRPIDWVIVGGESGNCARPMHPGWIFRLRDQCNATGTAFFFKQWGEFIPAEDDECDPGNPDKNYFWSDGNKYHESDGQRGGVALMCRVGKKLAGRLLDGATHNEYPQFKPKDANP